MTGISMGCNGGDGGGGGGGGGDGVPVCDGGGSRVIVSETSTNSSPNSMATPATVSANTVMETKMAAASVAAVHSNLDLLSHAEHAPLPLSTPLSTPLSPLPSPSTTPSPTPRQAPPATTATSSSTSSLSTSSVDNPSATTVTRAFCAEDDETLSTRQLMAAGAVAGIAEHIAMFPVDTVKTRMQSYVALRHPPAAVGILQTTRSIVAAQGISALWRGVSAVALSAGPAHALYFATYESVRGSLTRNLSPSSNSSASTAEAVHPVATAVAGACATVVGDGIMTPLDVVKQRMQLTARADGGYASAWACARAVYAHHGTSAFYAGYKATLLMNVPFTAVYFTGYEFAKSMLLDRRRRRRTTMTDGDAQPTGERMQAGQGVAGEFSVLSHCAAGAFAGGLAAAATNPLDVVKTRLQTQGEVGARRYGGLSDAWKRIRAEEGMAGLMRGVGPRVLFHMPAAAVCWTTYEFCKHVFRKGVMEADVVGGRR